MLHDSADIIYIYIFKLIDSKSRMAVTRGWEEGLSGAGDC